LIEKLLLFLLYFVSRQSLVVMFLLVWKLGQLSFNPMTSSGLEIFFSADHLVSSLNNLTFVIPKLLGSISILDEASERISLGE